MNDLVDTLRDIASTGFNDPERDDPKYRKDRTETPEWKAQGFGRDYDFILLEGHEYDGIWAQSEAALDWCYHFLGDVDRFGLRGFWIESRTTEYWLRRMEKNGLTDLRTAMENLQQQHWSDQLDQDEEAIKGFLEVE